MNDQHEYRQTTSRNMEAAISHLRATSRIWAEHKIYGDCSIKLKFVEGLAVQWEAVQAEVHRAAADHPGRPA